MTFKAPARLALADGRARRWSTPSSDRPGDAGGLGATRATSSCRRPTTRSTTPRRRWSTQIKKRDPSFEVTRAEAARGRGPTGGPGRSAPGRRGATAHDPLDAHLRPSGAEFVVDAYAPPSVFDARRPQRLRRRCWTRWRSRQARGRGDGRRAFVVVLDACGVGALPDAADYGDAGTNTLAHLAEAVGGLDLPTLERLGLGSILPIEGVAPAEAPAVHGRLAPLGRGQGLDDRALGADGRRRAAAPPTYPDGFPPEVVERVRRAATGRDVLGNAPRDGSARARASTASGTCETGELILYTSQDSVLQLAAHVDVRARGRAARALRCRARDARRRARRRPRDRAAVHAASPGAFERTPGRRDFALDAAGALLPRRAREARRATVHAVGKVARPVRRPRHRRRPPGADNAEAHRGDRRALLGELDAGLVFTNLIETDQVYGHRKDVEGFHARAARDRRRGRALARGAARRRPAGPHRRPRRRPGPRRAPTTRASTRRCWRRSRPRRPGRHDGPLADVGATRR